MFRRTGGKTTNLMAKILRVGLDISGLVGGKPATGVQRYTANLLKALIPHVERRELDLVLYAVTPIPTSNHPLAGLFAHPLVRRRSAPFQQAWYRVVRGTAMLLDRLDVFHVPVPLAGGYCPVPLVVTIHDMVAKSLSSTFTVKERAYLDDLIAAGERATEIIAVSQNTATEIRDHLNRPATVTPEGVDLSIFHPNQPTAPIRQHFEVDRYVLCVGTLHTRKNHLALIRAFACIQDRVPHTLLIVGGEGSGSAEIKAHLAANPHLRVQLAGYVPDEAMPALYAGADAFALPSLWEGFGLPLVEAMACGTPVLTSSVSALAEVAGDAALCVDPQSVEDIADGLHTLLTDEATRQRLIAAGFARARELSWDATAAGTVKVYRKAAGR
jgi:glycosyltransferase involved in cell wall biosynthesis